MSGEKDKVSTVKVKLKQFCPVDPNFEKNETNDADIIIIHDTYLINEINDINW